MTPTTNDRTVADVPPVAESAPVSHSHAQGRPRRRRGWLGPLAFLIVAAGAAAFFSPLGATVRTRLGLTGAAQSAVAQAAPKAEAADEAKAGPWDGRVSIRDDQFKSLGLSLAAVEVQDKPTRLNITGTTAYDPSTLTRVRPRFSSVASKVHVRIGQVVKVGDPLVELFSTDLAAAKSQFEERGAQWEHDRAQYDRIKPLYDQKAVSEKDYFDAFNDESKSRFEYRLSRDNLVVFGLSDDEINHIASEDGSQKARLTLRSPVEGLVTERIAAEGSLYDTADVLLTIAPQHKFWVIGNVYESDLSRVKVGQDWEIRFPFLDHVIMAKVEQVDARVDPTTRTIQIRTTVPNDDGTLKADMLVYGTLLVPPAPNCTVIPRTAMVVTDGTPYVFVRNADDPTRFERRETEIVEESRDHVVLRKGVAPGEQVVVRGSLIVAQMFEDAILMHGGAD